MTQTHFSVETPSVSDIVKASQGRWLYILANLGITVPDNHKHGACPKCGGKDRFRFDDKNGKGTWFCNQCGHGDGLDLVKLVTGKETKTACQEVSKIILLPTFKEIAPTPIKKVSAKKGIEHYEKIKAFSSLGESQYLINKGFANHQCLITRQQYTQGEFSFPVGSLLLPLVDTDSVIKGGQLISLNGEKSLLSGSTLSGSFIIVRQPEKKPLEQIVITEGFATGLSLSKCLDALIVASVSATNLVKVAQQLRAQYPDAKIIIAGDNDFVDGKDNTGKMWAERAGKTVDGWVTLPPTHYKADWDDFRQENSLEKLKEAFFEEMTYYGKDRTRLPQGFRLTQEYLWFDKQITKSDGDIEVRNIKISSPIKVTAITCDADGSNYGRLLEWEDTYGNCRKWAMPMEMLSGSGEELRRVLLVNGLSYINISGQARAHLMEYISLCRPERKVTCVNKTGWHGNVYVLQDEVVGNGADSVILQTSSVQGKDFRVSGTSEQWREHIGKYCVGNARLAFSVSLAFASPLLRLAGVGGGGYHLKGESTDGKTTTMKVASSVCGGTDYWYTWRATGNALEGTACRRNDATLMLDEIREVDGREAGNIAYMLANGQGKARAKTDGSVRETNRWNLLFLSTGELSLVEHASNAGERTYAGVEVRMIQIPSDSGKYGVFEDLHHFTSGKAIAEYLEHAVTRYHGTPFRDWLKYITNNLSDVSNTAKALLKEYTTKLMPENAGNQVGRAITRFALVAMAGEMATRAGITGWKEGEAFISAKKCLSAWMKERGHTANQEDMTALEQVSDFISRHQFSRFADWYDEYSRPASMMGFRRVEKDTGNGESSITFYVLPTAWKEICKGFDARKVVRLCVEKGWLETGKDGKTQTSIRLPEIGVKRVYVFNSDVLGCSEIE
ncbi:DUF927 domain-containing protein [Proteus mirabilis]|uniref:DUF927 domain-containing protein n=1 Tax=Proteus mirabilis TaxID=584 RepID=UPI000789F3DC|nr:DUF927 domain-containing protein [Proteus mirabilis]MBG2943068.1 DUF927 domain-containing protein [Proteus mirabilis]MCL8556708.1 DUF927 domain-containing protein [Proteus mirabilis]MCL8599817.1 DUF927 domain-containing protein [Proteus mirabilis]WSE86434.1 DUF927 domain-containing protein [Proteus mirabilis]HEK3217305.1 DUF927 domain-containing protein [Proteus mirabilis]